jgi:HlyD family type I secretion membrane fusion protein
MLPNRDALIPLNALEDDASIRHRFAVPRDLRRLSIAVVFVTAMAIAFGLLIQVDQVVRAEGILETNHQLFEVRSRHSGQLSQVFVQRGDRVQATTILAQLDTQAVLHQLALLQAEQTELEHTLWSHFYSLEPLLDHAEAKRLLRQLDDIPDPMAGTRQHWQLRQHIHTQAQTLQSEQDIWRARTWAQQERATGAHAAYRLAQQEVSRYQALVQQQLESPAQLALAEQALLQHEREWLQLKAEIPIQRAHWRHLESQLQDQRLSFKLSHLQQFEAASVAHARNLLEQQHQQAELAQHLIRAPVAGTIDEVLWHGTGEVIQAAQALAIMRPEFDINDLWVAVEVAASDVVWLQPGMTFRANVQGRSGEDHGRIHGTLGFISSATSESESNLRRYRIEGKIEHFEASSRRANTAQLMLPGLPLEVTIQAGERRLLHYVLDPFRHTLNRAWREPS